MLAAGSMLDVVPIELIEAAGAAGFDGLGLRLSGEHELADVAAVAAALDTHGLVLHDAEVHRITVDTPPPDRLIDAAAEIGAGHLLIVSDLDDASETVRRLVPIAERCRSAGVVPALEYMAWTTPNDPRGAIHAASATGCVVIVDALHHVRVGASPDDLSAIVEAGVFGWLQLCDAPAAAPADLLHEARHDRLVPGTGDLPLSDLIARLPPGAVVSVEVQSDAIGARTSAVERARILHDSARRALGHDNSTG
jgi:sugar phosphate isomerase/epimerase